MGVSCSEPYRQPRQPFSLADGALWSVNEVRLLDQTEVVKNRCTCHFFPNPHNEWDQVLVAEPRFGHRAGDGRPWPVFPCLRALVS